MIYYASRTGTKRNLAAMRAAGFRVLVSRDGVWRTEGFPYAIDNGVWGDTRAGRAFDEDAFERLIDRLGHGADFIILPDIIAGGLRSLELSVRWLNRARSMCGKVLIPVQDGMTHDDLAGLVGPLVGIFLGGSTEWKLATMEYWGAFSATRRIHYHVGRVNTRKRLRLAIVSGATSCDGSGVARFALHTPKVARWMDYRDLFTPIEGPGATSLRTLIGARER